MKSFFTAKARRRRVINVSLTLSKTVTQLNAMIWLLFDKLRVTTRESTFVFFLLSFSSYLLMNKPIDLNVIATDGNAVLDAARDSGIAVRDNGFSLGGVRWRLC